LVHLSVPECAEETYGEGDSAWLSGMSMQCEATSGVTVVTEDGPAESAGLIDVEELPGSWSSLLSPISPAAPDPCPPALLFPHHHDNVRLKPTDFSYAVPCVAGRNRLSFFGHVDILDLKAQAAKAKSDARSFMLMADEDCSTRISLDEWIAAGLNELLFHHIDTDGSGDLDLAEVEAAFAAGVIDRIPGVL